MSGQLKGKGKLGVQGSSRRKEVGKGGRGMSDMAESRDCFALPSQMCSGSQKPGHGSTGPSSCLQFRQKLGLGKKQSGKDHMDLIFRKGSHLNVRHGQPEVCWWPGWHIMSGERPWRCMG